MSIVLVTGAAGFLGVPVVEALLGRGIRVRTVEHRTPLPAHLRERCELVAGDLAETRTRQEALRGGVAGVCHLAAYVPSDLADLAQAAACFEANALVTLELAREAALANVGRFVFASSASVYAPGPSPRTENDRTFPDRQATSYAASKLAAEVFLSAVARRSELQAVTLRIGSPYGPGMPDRSVISTFMRRAARGEPLRVLGGGHAAYNFVRAQDVAECVLRALEGSAAGIFNVASGEHTNLRELATAVVATYGGKGSVQVEPAPADALADARRTDSEDEPRPGLPAVAIDRARDAWDFAPADLTSGLREYRNALEASSP